MLVLGGGNCAWSDDVIDANVRAQMLKHGDGRVAHLETEYNNLFIDKHGSMLGLSSMHTGRPNYVELIVDLKDPDAMPVPYNQTMTAALAYPAAPKRILMIGLGAGSISTYLGRAMPDAQIDVVELDPGVISAGKDYFGLRETDPGTPHCRRRPRLSQPPQGPLRPYPSWMHSASSAFHSIC